MQSYLDLIKDIIENGTDKGDRTGTGTRSVFGRQMRFNLSEGFPLLTTKKIHTRSVIHELLWFLKGDTNIKYLQDNKVRIWNEWADENGDLGPLYGAQWRAWDDGRGNKIDQVSKVVDQLKNNPNSRRIIIEGWNVALLPDESVSPQENVKNGKMALPPCHKTYQFYVADGKLSCQLYLRSSDVMLGLPFNICTTSLLTHMLAQQTDLTPWEVVISFGDAHLYQNHLTEDIVYEQLKRSPKELPQLKIKRRPASIFDYKYEDFEIVGYDPDPVIKAPIAV